MVRLDENDGPEDAAAKWRQRYWALITAGAFGWLLGFVMPTRPAMAALWVLAGVAFVVAGAIAARNVGGVGSDLEAEFDARASRRYLPFFSRNLGLSYIMLGVVIVIAALARAFGGR